MPYAEDFEAAGRRLDRVANLTETLSSPLTSASGTDVVAGGQLTVVVATVLGQSAGICHRSAFELHELARECRRRAQVCRDATAAALAHQQRMRQHSAQTSSWRVEWARHVEAPSDVPNPGSPPAHPWPPPRPPAWVDIRR
ncbi:MAG: hypothetical protein GXP35_17730 [Actinobacteria bacterium]|nr:hypothetical protein [Actinomycetota bacterium]